MRRLVAFLRWLNRPVTVELVPVSVNPPPPPSTPSDRDVVEVDGSRVVGLPIAPLGQRVQEEASVIGAACWPDWTPPIRRLTRTARRILTDTSVVFTADDLPLPDDPYTADVDWILAVYNLLTERRDGLPLAQRVALHRAVQTPRGARLTLTVYVPYGVGELAKRTVIQSLRNEVQSVLGPHILWGDVDARCFPSDDPAWAVSIAAVDAPMEGVA